MTQRRSASQLLLLAVLVMLSGGAAQAAPLKWNLDLAHSHIGFSVRHLVVSRVKGKFNDFKGEVLADKDGKITKLSGTVMVASIDTGEPRRDEHLRSPDFFDQKKYPLMKFESSKITWSGKKVMVTGKLTIKNVTKTVTLNGEFLGKQTADFGRGPEDHMGYSFTAKINRKDYGLNFNRLANGVMVVGDLVDIELEMEAIRKP